jgi:hypothetical protein
MKKGDFLSRLPTARFHTTIQVKDGALSVETATDATAKWAAIDTDSFSPENKALFEKLSQAQGKRRRVWFGIWTDRQNTPLGKRPLWQEKFAQKAKIIGFKPSPDGRSCIVEMTAPSEEASQGRFVRLSVDIRDIDAPSLIVTG